MADSALTQKISAIETEAEAIGLSLSDLQIRQFAIYWEQLLRWNAKANLISKNDERRILQRHLLESVAMLQLNLIPECAELIDVGTGGGFPGLPLKLVCPDLSVTLLDSKHWKTLFLKNLVTLLQIDNVSVICERAEVAVENKNFAGQFDFVVTRAVAKLSELFELVRGFLKPGGKLLAFKGSNLETELTLFQQSYDFEVEIIRLPKDTVAFSDKIKIVSVQT